MHLYIEKMKKKARQKLVFWLASTVFTGLYSLLIYSLLPAFSQNLSWLGIQDWMKLFRFFSEVEVNIPRATRKSSAYLSNRQISNKSWSNRNSKRIRVCYALRGSNYIRVVLKAHCTSLLVAYKTSCVS